MYRDIPDATAFGRDVASKLRRNERGEFFVRPSLVTDGLGAYKEAFDNVFGDDADRAMMIKRYSYTDRNGNPSKKRRYAGADRIAVSGSPAVEDIHTSYIERQNLNLRMGNRRYNRRTNAFSKTLLNHERHLALWIVYHNLCWVPRPARPRRDATGQRAKQWGKRLPAAIAAGVTDRLWEIEDLLALTDAFVAQRKGRVEQPPAEEEQCTIETINEAKPTYWVFRHSLQRSTKTHRADCVNCRDGKGKKDGAKTTGEWFPFHSEEDAVAAAQAMEPERNSICKMCLGSYNSLGYRHAGSSRQSAPA